MVYVKKRSQSYSCCILEQIQWEDKQFLHKGIGDWGLGIYSKAVIATGARSKFILL